MRPYRVTDYPEIAHWYQARGLRAPPLDSLPLIGQIEPGVAAGFMWRTDSSIVLFDGWISNPAAPRLRAARALIAAEGLLTAEAARQGFRIAQAGSRVRGVQRSARRNGFKVTDSFRMMVKAIGSAELAHNSRTEACDG